MDQTAVPDSSAGAATTTQETNTTATDDCAMAGVSPQVYEATPRANREAEILAILAGGDVVATEDDYQRAVRDHAAIVALDGRFASFYTSTARPAVGDNLTVFLADDAPAPPFEAAARCINARYDATMSTSEVVERHFFDIRLNGVFNLDLVKTEYETLPGVWSVDPVVLTPPPRVEDDEVYITGVVRDAETWVYSANITKLSCTIHVSIATGGNGSAEVVEWGSTPDELPESASCQRPDPDM